MSKKKLLKNIQKEKSNKNTKPNEGDNYFKFITTLAILLIIFILSYIIIGIFYTKEIDFNKNKDKEKTDEINIDNDTIMLGQLFEQSDNEYYVLVYNPDDEVSSIPTWLSNYEGKTDKTKIYKVNSNMKFNSKYIVKKDSNKSAKTLDELKIIEPTMLKITNKNISDYIEGEENIINILKGE